MFTVKLVKHRSLSFGRKLNKSDHNLLKIWNQVPRDYYQAGIKRNLLQRIWHRNKIRVANSLIAKLQFNNCLDLGCASGYMLSEIAKLYPRVRFTGVDVYHQAILFAAKSYPGIKFIQADAHNLPFGKDAFDLIISYETFEHVADPLLFLKESKRVLRKSGTFILAMDSGTLLFRIIWSLWERTFGRVWRGAHLNPVHHTHLEQLVKKAGYKVKNKHFTHLGLEVVFVLTLL